jgi:hypothetical protein
MHFALALIVGELGNASKNYPGRTLHCSTSSRNSDSFNVCNLFYWKQLAVLIDIQLLFFRIITIAQIKA